MVFDFPNHIRSLVCEYVTDAMWMRKILTDENDKMTVGLACRIFSDLTRAFDARILTDVALMFECRGILMEHKGNPQVDAVLEKARKHDRRFSLDTDDVDFAFDNMNFNLMSLKKSEINRPDVRDALVRMDEEGAAMGTLVMWIARSLISIHDSNCKYVALLRSSTYEWKISSSADTAAWIYLTRDAHVDVVFWIYEILKASCADGLRVPYPSDFLECALSSAILRCDVDAVKSILGKVEDIERMAPRRDFDDEVDSHIDVGYGADLAHHKSETNIWEALNILFWVDHSRAREVIDTWIEFAKRCAPTIEYPNAQNVHTLGTEHTEGNTDLPGKPLTYYVPPNLDAQPHRHWRIPPGVKFTPLCEFKLDHLKWWVAQGDLLPQPPLHVMGIFAYRLDSPREIREWCFSEYKPITSSLYALHYRNEDVIRDYVGEPMRTLVFNATEPSIDSDVALDHFKMMFNKSSVFYEMSIHVAVQDWKFPTLLKQNPIAVECQKWFYANVTTNPSAEDKDNEVTSTGNLLMQLATLRSWELFSEYISVLPALVVGKASKRITLLDLMLKNGYRPHGRSWGFKFSKGTWTLNTIKLMARMAGYVPKGSEPHPIELKDVVVPEWYVMCFRDESPDLLQKSYKDYLISKDAGFKLGPHFTYDAQDFLYFFFDTVDTKEYVEVVRAEESDIKTSLIFLLKFHTDRYNIRELMKRIGRDMNIPLYLNPYVILDMAIFTPRIRSANAYKALERHLNFPRAQDALDYLKDKPDFAEEYEVWNEIDEFIRSPRSATEGMALNYDDDSDDDSDGADDYYDSDDYL